MRIGDPVMIDGWGTRTVLDFFGEADGTLTMWLSDGNEAIKLEGIREVSSGVYATAATAPAAKAKPAPEPLDTPTQKDNEAGGQLALF